MHTQWRNLYLLYRRRRVLKECGGAKSVFLFFARGGAAPGNSIEPFFVWYGGDQIELRWRAVCVFIGAPFSLLLRHRSPFCESNALPPTTTLTRAPHTNYVTPAVVEFPCRIFLPPPCCPSELQIAQHPRNNNNNNKKLLSR